MKIGFIGVGKLGLPVAVCMDMKGHDVMGYDLNPKRMSHEPQEFREAGPDKTGNFNAYLANSGVRFGSVPEVVAHGDIIFLAIQTPHGTQYEGITRIPDDRADFDYTYLKEAMTQIATEADKQSKDVIVAVISTCLPGTMRREIMPLLNDRVKLVYNPYFIAMGTVMYDFFNPEFILAGSEDPEALEAVVSFYKTITDAPVQTMRIESAEATKVCYNTFITFKICFANMIMEMAHKTKANVDEITDALKKATDRIISTAYLSAGMGDGGGCHPRDCIAMSWYSNTLGLTYNMFDNVMAWREQQTEWLADLMIEQHQATKLPMIIFGYAFKPGTELLIGSPALLLANIIVEKGFQVKLIDGNAEESLGLPLDVAVYLVGCKHPEYENFVFPKGSIVLDPHRYVREQPEATLIPIGVGSK